MKPKIWHLTSKLEPFWVCDDEDSLATGVGDTPLDAYNDYQSDLKELGSEARP